MRSKIFALFSIIFIIILNVHTLSGAAGGEIVGTVTDAVTGKPLPGTNVYLEGTAIGTATNLKGYYRIQQVPPGLYLIKITFIGYKAKTMSINLSMGETKELDLQLEYDVVKGETVTITAQAEGQMAAINQQISARNIKNVVAADRIQEIPDVNAAESLGRLPGVSILRSGGEADKVSIRGLSPRFNNVSIEGVQMTSTDRDDRSVNLASISSNTLAGIEIVKAITPDMPANSLGGSVNLRMREAKQGLHSDLLLQGGYNGHDRIYDDYKLTGTVSNRYFKDKLGVIIAANAERVNRGDDEWQGSWEQAFGKQYELNSNSLRLRDTKDIRKRLGASLVLDYVLPAGSIKLSNFYNQLKKEFLTRVVNYPGAEPGGGRLSYAMNQQPGQKTGQMINALAGKFDIFWSTLDVRLSHSMSTVESFYESDWSFTQNITTPVTSETGFVDVQDLPDLVPIDLPSTFLGELTRDTQDTQERNMSASLDWQIPFIIKNAVSGFFKMGGFYTHKTRKQDINSFFVPFWNPNFTFINQALIERIPELQNLHIQNNSLMLQEFVDNNFTVDNFLDGAYVLPAMARLDILDQIREYTLNTFENDPERRLWVNTRSSISRDHDGYEALSAGYMMAEINLFNNKLMLVPGFRYEHEKREYTAFHYVDPGEQDIDPSLIPDTTHGSTNEFWLPMLHLRYKPLDWLSIRIAQTRTLTRPNFRSIIPRRFLTVSSREGYGGNSLLDPASSWNTDVNISVYSNNIGLFSVNGFYKEIDDLIWSAEYYIPKGEAAEFNLPTVYEKSNYTTPTNNQYKAYFRGFEVEWQTNFRYLPKPLNNLVLNINYTHISSETKYPYSYKIRVPGTFPPQNTRIDTFRVGRMEDQPDDVLNISIGYDYRDFSFRLSYYYQTKTLNSLATFDIEDEYTLDYQRWDLTMKQELPWKGLQLFFNANNLTDTPDRQYQLRTSFPTYREYYGRSYAIGLRFIY